VIYLASPSPDDARREFDRLFEALDTRVNNQRIFDPVKLGHAPHLRARLIDTKAERRSEDTSEGGAR
jgi:hypothetical protein